MAHGRVSARELEVVLIAFGQGSTFQQDRVEECDRAVGSLLCHLQIQRCLERPCFSPVGPALAGVGWVFALPGLQGRGDPEVVDCYPRQLTNVRKGN